MPSSSWRLIRDEAPSAPLAPAPAAPVALEPAADSAFTPAQRGVLRGSGRMNFRAAASAGPAASPVAAPEVTTAEEQALAEEIRRIEQAAEERGYQVGVTRAESELRASVEAAGILIERLHAIAPERTSEIAHAIAELALSVAKRIVQHEVRIEPSLLCVALEEAVGTINGSPEAHVLLNPAAVEPVHQAWEALHGRAYLGKKWVFEGDPTLPVGGCTLRYEHGFVEAGLEAQLEEIGIALDRAIPNLARTAVEEEVV
jgi:flagellar biosynthesis/type III secretory pathway protein FliH